MGIRSGVVLIIVLIVVAILTTLVVDLIYFYANKYGNIRQFKGCDEIAIHCKVRCIHNCGTIRNESLENLTSIRVCSAIKMENSEGYWSIYNPSLPVGDGVASVAVVDERSK